MSSSVLGPHCHQFLGLYYCIMPKRLREFGRLLVRDVRATSKDKGYDDLAHCYVGCGSPRNVGQVFLSSFRHRRTMSQVPPHRASHRTICQMVTFGPSPSFVGEWTIGIARLHELRLILPDNPVDFRTDFRTPCEIVWCFSVLFSNSTCVIVQCVVISTTPCFEPAIVCNLATLNIGCKTGLSLV